MIRSNTNVGKKDRQTVVLKDFKGLDTVHSPMNLSAMHAVSMRNLINRDGVNRKRRGWQQVNEYLPDTKAAGTYECDLQYEQENVVYSNRYLLHFYYEKSELKAKAYTGGIDGTGSDIAIQKASGEVFTQGLLKFYAFEGKLYVVGCGTVLVCSAKANGTVSIVSLRFLQTQKNAEGKEEIYVPVTYVLDSLKGIHGAADYTSLEGFALVAAMIVYANNADRYDQPTANEPLGEDVASTKYDRVMFGDQSFQNRVDEDVNILTPLVKNRARFTIDADDRKAIQDGKSVIALFRANQMKGYDIEWWNGSQLPVLKALYFNQRDNFYAGIEIEIYVNGVLYKTLAGAEGLVQRKATIPIYDGGESVNVNLAAYTPKDESFYLAFVGKNLFADVNQILKFAEACAGEDLIGKASEIEFVITYAQRNSYSELAPGFNISPTMITAFGAEGNPNRLLFCDGRNRILYSEYRKPFYIGSQNTITLGSTPITGWIKGTETSLYVFKQSSRQEENLFVIQGELVTGEDNRYNVNEGEVVFRNKGYFLPESALCQEAVCKLANDILIVSENGVYGIELSSNNASTERFARARAEQIKNLLSAKDLSSVKITCFDNKLYLAAEGECYVADARYRASFGGDMSDSFNYEWWCWDDMPVYYWFVAKGNIHFVTEDNRICSFYNGFSDHIHDVVSVVVIDGSGVTLSNDYAAYNRIELNNAYSRFVDADKIVGITQNALILSEDVLFSTVNEGDVVYFDMVSGTNCYPIEIGKPYTISEIDIRSGNATIVNDKGSIIPFTFDMHFAFSANRFRMSKRASERYSLTVDSEAKENNAVICDHTGDAVELISYNGVTNYSATVYNQRAVVAEWETGAFDLGNSLFTKTIEKLSVAFDRGASKNLKLFYQTSNRGAPKLMKALERKNDFDLKLYDMLLFSFEKKFESSYTKRFLIRNFNYISFLIISDADEDFSLSSMSVVYKINKNNRGEA